MNIAIIVGGAETALAEYELAAAMCVNHNVEIMVINDMIATFPGTVTAVTLHPDKLTQWLDRRKRDGLLPVKAVWSNRPAKLVTNTTRDLGGSSGFFASKIAKEKGRKSILCGVPMTVEGNHFVRHQRWSAALAFRRPWVTYKNEYAPYIRSFSGWTKQEFGEPTTEFLA